MEKNWIKIQDHGFQPDEILPDHYVLGGLGSDKIPDEIINPSRDWRDKLPSFIDIQFQNGLETMNCAIYGTENGIQIYEKTKYGDDQDYSERFVGIGAETAPAGNSPHKVCEWIRHNGLIKGELLPFSKDINTWREYYSPKPLTQTLLDEGKKWLIPKIFKHTWVFQGGSLAGKQAALWKALQMCAPGVSVVAWKMRNGKYYKNTGERDNHWVTLVYGEWGKRWIILDHYDNILKELEWNYDFGFAKRYYVKKNQREALPIKKKLMVKTNADGYLRSDLKKIELPAGSEISEEDMFSNWIPWNFIVETKAEDLSFIELLKAIISKLFGKK